MWSKYGLFLSLKKLYKVNSHKIGKNSPNLATLLQADQGDQIERFFAYLTIDYFGQFFENLKSRIILWATFFQGKSYAFVLTKNSWA
jgi:hypothetical protein